MSEAPLRVLVVDDDADTVECTAALFEGLGAEVARAYTGRTAVELALTSRPDIILLDLAMPDLSGYEVARRLESTAMPKRPLLVAVSAYERPEDRSRCVQAGFDLHFTKPIDFSILKEILVWRGAREPSTSGRLAEGQLRTFNELLAGYLRMAATFLRIAQTTRNPQSRELLITKAGRVRQAVRSQLVRTPALYAGLSDLVFKGARDRAPGMTGADKGDIRLLQPSGQLTIAHQRGFSDEFFEHVRTVTIGDSPACARAMRARATVVIEDVNVDEEYADHRGIAARAGFRAVASTPIIEWAGFDVLGVLAAHFEEPHKPQPQEVLTLEDCAPDTAVLLEWASH